jgi:hypothetical protein
MGLEGGAERFSQVLPRSVERKRRFPPTYAQTTSREGTLSRLLGGMGIAVGLAFGVDRPIPLDTGGERRLALTTP